MIEYGFTFKENEETEDTIFDLVLGKIKGTDADFTAKVEKAWADNEKYARAVCEAHDKQV
jgi:uncharacterized protein (UPF0128 family)